MTRPILLFADRLPPLTGGMEMHARYFVEHFQQHRRYPLLGVVTRDHAQRDCLLRGGQLTPTSLARVRELLPTPPAIVFFNSGRWIENLGEIRTAFPGVPFVYRTGGNEIVEASLERAQITDHRDRQTYWARALTQNIDLLITNSAFTEERLCALGLDTMRFARCVGGVNVAALRASAGTPMPVRDEPLLFCAARFVPYKNHALLLEVFSELRRRGHRLRLRLAGDGPLFAEARVLATRWRLTEHVDFLGALTNEEVCAESARADVYVQLSADRVTEVPGGSYIHAEGMGRALLEALSCGTYVVAARAGALPEVVTPERGKLVDLGPAEAVADALEPVLAVLPGRRPFFEGYGWEPYFEGYERIWENLDARADRH